MPKTQYETKVTIPPLFCFCDALIAEVAIPYVVSTKTNSKRIFHASFIGAIISGKDVKTAMT